VTQIHIGFTGTSDTMRDEQLASVRELLLGYPPVINQDRWFHHGDCVNADYRAGGVADALGFHIHLHPPQDDTRRAFSRYDVADTPRPFLERNHRIVDCTSVLIAAPRGALEQMRSGTWATVRYARKLHRPIYIVSPNGRVRKENV
jgi:hypothetical protein